MKPFCQILPLMMGCSILAGLWGCNFQRDFEADLEAEEPIQIPSMSPTAEEDAFLPNSELDDENDAEL